MCTYLISLWSWYSSCNTEEESEVIDYSIEFINQGCIVSPRWYGFLPSKFIHMNIKFLFECFSIYTTQYTAHVYYFISTGLYILLFQKWSFQIVCNYEWNIICMSSVWSFDLFEVIYNDWVWYEYDIFRNSIKYHKTINYKIWVIRL